MVLCVHRAALIVVYGNGVYAGLDTPPCEGGEGADPERAVRVGRLAEGNVSGISLRFLHSTVVARSREYVRVRHRGERVHTCAEPHLKAAVLSPRSTLAIAVAVGDLCRRSCSAFSFLVEIFQEVFHVLVPVSLPGCFPNVFSCVFLQSNLFYLHPVGFYNL